MKKSPVYCSNKKVSFILTVLMIIAGAIQGCDYFFPPLSGDKISPEEAYGYINKHKNDKDVILLDVGTKREFDSLSIENSLNLDFTLPDFPAMVQKLDKEKRYILFDLNGKKSAMAFELMKEEKFTKVHYVAGGFAEWQNKKLPFLQLKK